MSYLLSEQADPAGSTATGALETLPPAGQFRDVPGIGPERARRIREAWVAQKSVRDIMIFLQGHGIGSAHAARIYKQYGESAIATRKSVP